MADLPSSGKARSPHDEVSKECEEVELAIVELRVAYEQYFLGVERRPPVDAHKALKKRLQKLKGAFVRQTAMKFRIQGVAQKFSTYERLWERTLQEIENGTYRRDLAKLKRRAAARKAASTQEPAAPGNGAKAPQVDPLDDLDIDEDLDGAAPVPAPPAATRPVVPPAVVAPQVGPLTPAVAPVVAPVVASTLPAVLPAAPRAPGPQRAPAAPTLPTVRPVPPSSAPRPMAPAGQLSDDKMRALYEAYVKAKRRCNEDTSKLSFDTVASSLRKQVPELMKRHNARAIEFKVVIKDGKALLKAVPKEG
jgi:hypothetical protein